MTARSPARTRRRLRWLPIFLLLTVVFAAAVSAEPERVVNGAEPRDGVQTVALRELWRVGGADDDVLLGVIDSVVMGEDGTTWLLDTQLNTAHAIGPDGEFLGDVGREGDGPGEVRRPGALVQLPNGNLGFVLRQPGRIVEVAVDGEPVGSRRMTPLGGGEGSMISPVTAFCRNGWLVAAGRQFTGFDGGQEVTMVNFISHFDPVTGAELRRFENFPRPLDVNDPSFAERDEYTPVNGGWAMGPDGRIYLPPERDRYLVRVFAADGSVQREIERPYRPRKRDDRDKQDILDGVRMVVNGQLVQVDVDIEDRDPAIVQLHVSDAGELWVLGSVGARDPEEGILQTWDVHDGDGVFVRQVRLAAPGDGRQDAVLMPADGRVVVVRGNLDSQNNTFGGGGAEGDADAAELIVICYSMD